MIDGPDFLDTWGEVLLWVLFLVALFVFGGIKYLPPSKKMRVEDKEQESD